MSENNPNVLVSYDPTTDTVSVDKAKVSVKTGPQTITWRLATIPPQTGALSWAATNGIYFVTKPNRSDWPNSQPSLSGQIYRVTYTNSQTSGTTTYGYEVNVTYTPAGGTGSPKHLDPDVENTSDPP